MHKCKCNYKEEQNAIPSVIQYNFFQVHLLYEIPRNVTICALTKCEIIILERKDLLLLFADYPKGNNIF